MAPVCRPECLLHLVSFDVGYGRRGDQKPLELAGKVLGQALEVPVAGDDPLRWVPGEQRASESIGRVDHDHLAPGEVGIHVVV